MVLNGRRNGLPGFARRRSRPTSTATPRCSSSNRSASSRARGSSSAHVTELPEPGRYLTAVAGKEPVLVLRDDDGELRAFRNVCRHRGSRLLSGTGECPKAIRCLYHGWTYRLDGQLIGVPEGRSIPGLDKSELGLFPARIEVMCGLIFVNLDMDARAAGRAGGRPAGAPCALRLRDARASAREAELPARQLEDRGGQLPRGLPRADRPSGVDAAPRLQALRRGGPRQLGLVRRAAARQAVREPRRARPISAWSRRCPAWPRRTSGSGASS